MNNLSWKSLDSRNRGGVRLGLARWGSLAALGGLLIMAPAAPAQILFETLSPYHLVRVYDEDDVRILSFDGSTETRMSLLNPLQGHFEYTEYFHTPWLWNTQMARVLMIGLGGASAQRSYEYYYPNVQVETAELDSVVVRVAREYFGYKEGPRHQVHVSDGRLFLRRSRANYDAVIVDAYTSSRYGSCIPYHLATKEFFALAHGRMTTNGVLAYNVIGSVKGWQSDIVGALYQTMQVVFPQVYLFPAKDSENTVLVATKAERRMDLAALRQRSSALLLSRRVTLPRFAERVGRVQNGPPAGAEQCPVLSDDFAPIDNLLLPKADRSPSRKR